MTKKATIVGSEKFGNFSSLSAFLDSYRVTEKKNLLDSAFRLKPEIAAKRIRRRQSRKRDLVEIEATLADKLSDDNGPDGHHHRMLIIVTAIYTWNDRIAADVTDAYLTGRKVLVAIRFGDSMGIQDKIEGLDVSAKLKIKGEWIPSDKVVSHGGAQTSLLHFTHHPLGFICTPIRCYA